MKAVIVERPGEVSVREVPVPEAGPDEVLIRVERCGLCGTDLHIIDGEFPPTVYPIIIGHELGGTIEQVGAHVAGVKPGARVGVDPTLNCGACYFCQRGKGNLCERWNAVGVGRHPGGFAQYLVVPERCVYPIPDSMSFAAAALIEPVSCVVHGFHLLQPRIGESYLIYGAGPMGLQNALLARANGARSVAILDLNEARLEQARSFGFDLVGKTLDDVRLVEPRGFDHVIEATGRTKVAELAIDAVIRGGKLLIFGVCPPGETAGYEPFKIYNDEITILGTMAVINSYGQAVDVVGSGVIDPDQLVTHTLPIDRFAEAVQIFRAGSGLKIQIDPWA